ncbi:MAG: phenylalanine 4-monooxygenase [Actinobacteria bacterium]|nr:phenylalanine 4-monooxygenase [Actinomycetota bacterium]
MTTSTAATGPSLYELPADHPGSSDQAYRERRAAIAAVGEAYVVGQRIPEVVYTPEEDEVWRMVQSHLTVEHDRYAVAAYRDGAARLALRTDRVPQLQEVSDRLFALTGWRITPVPGLVPTRVFYGSLAERRFMSTQYIRHHSVPFYTPEPDVVHELIGHCNMLAEPRLADLYQLAGDASLRAESDEALEFFSRVFWFSLEFGVLRADGELRTYGAGLLSSYGEIGRFREARIEPFDLRTMGTTDYDISKYQPVLFAAESFDRAYDDLVEFFSTYGEAAYRVRWAGAADEEEAGPGV